MRQITSKLRDAEKKGRIKSRNGNDHLGEMFVQARKKHWINGSGKSCINTGIPCIEIRPCIQVVVCYIESIGVIPAPGVIFADVPKEYCIHKRIPPLIVNGQWIVSIKCDCIFANIKVVQFGINLILPSSITICNMHNVIFTLGLQVKIGLGILGQKKYIRQIIFIHENEKHIYVWFRN
jgi:hypothetical protein